ncbi:MAG: hypothetical protein M3O86_02920 [Actinomycetota bacterium]|nr:hypothetical protein [Actinomycetota bacterium]
MPRIPSLLAGLALALAACGGNPAAPEPTSPAVPGLNGSTAPTLGTGVTPEPTE